MKEELELAGEFGREIIKSTISLFEKAYIARAKGTTEVALLVQVDIMNAGRAIAPKNSRAEYLGQVLCEAHRQAVKSAGAAVDSGVPLVVALLIIRHEMENRLTALMKESR